MVRGLRPFVQLGFQIALHLIMWDLQNEDGVPQASEPPRFSAITGC